MTAPGLVKADPANQDHWAWPAEYLADRDCREQLLADAATIWPGDEGGIDQLTFSLEHAPRPEQICHDEMSNDCLTRYFGHVPSLSWLLLAILYRAMPEP